MFKKIEANELNERLVKHKSWPENSGQEGERLDLSEADLRWADLRWADLWGTKIQLSQLIGEPASLAKLPEYLIAHAESEDYIQSIWGIDCGSPCCLAGAAGHFLGVNNPAAGILAIRDCFAAVDFDLSVLYECDAGAAKAELKRACLALESKN